MNAKVVSLATTGIFTATGATLAGYFFAFAVPDRVPSGKTLKTRYPKLKVPAYSSSVDGRFYDNSFWMGKTQRLILQ